MKLFSLFGEILIDDEKAQQSLDGVDDKGKKAELTLGSLGKTAGKLALSLGAMGGAALLAMGVKGVSAADDFNKAMNGLQAETGAANEEMGELEDIATRIYNNNFGESFEDIAQAMAEVKTTTGAAGQELETMTTNAIMLRDTFEFEVSASVNTANSLMKQFGISGDEAFTLIAQGAQNGANKNGDLLDVLNEYAPQFKALGFSAEQFTDILIQGANDGAFQVDKVGDAIKEFTIRSKDLSDASLQAFEDLGLNGKEMSAQFAAGGESAQNAFQTVVAKLGEVEDPLMKNQIGVALFGTMFEDLEATAITSLANVQSVADGSADTLAQINDVKYDSLGEALTGIGRNFETGVLIPLGDRVIPLLERFAQWMIDNMPMIQEKVNSALDVVIGLFNGFGDAIQFVIDNSNILLPVVIGLTAAIAAQAIIGTINKLYKTWSAATKTQTTVQWLLNAALNANPLGMVALAIGAVIAAGVLLWKNWDKVKEFAGKLWDKLKEIGGNIKDFFGDVFGGLADGFKWYVNKWIDALNFLIRGLNKIQVKVPDWVPVFGGKEFGINIKELPHLAKGTDFFEGGMAIVGEQGPELVNLPQGSEVTPNDETMKMLQHDNRPLNVTLNVDGRDLSSVTSRPNNDRLQYQQRSNGGLAPA